MLSMTESTNKDKPMHFHLRNLSDLDSARDDLPAHTFGAHQPPVRWNTTIPKHDELADQLSVSLHDFFRASMRNNKNVIINKVIYDEILSEITEKEEAKRRQAAAAHIAQMDKLTSSHEA